MCEKVESKGRTTYNEVADELVRDFATPPEPGEHLPAIVLLLGCSRKKQAGSAFSCDQNTSCHVKIVSAAQSL